MKIHFISDLHLDFWIRELNPQSPKFKKQLEQYSKTINLSEADVLIIAGDLGHYFAQDSAFLKHCKTIYKHVILVRGNHDMYLVGKKQQSKYLRDSFNRVYEMKRWCAENDVHYLDGNVISFDGYNFFGAGMSWDMSYAEEFVDNLSYSSVFELFTRYMNDPRLIFQDGVLNCSVPMAYGGSFYQSGFKQKEYFESEKKKLEAVNGSDNIDIVVSHYGPMIPPDLDEEYKDVTSTFYYFDGIKDIERIKPKYWIYGHTHRKYEWKHGDTTILTNPLGYPGENTYTVVRELTLD